MSFVRPTLTEIVDRVQQDFTSRLELVAPILRRSLTYVFSRVIAGAAHLLHGHLDYLSRQVFPDLSDREYLIRQAALYDLSLKPAEFANGAITFTGVDGSVVAAGTKLTRADGLEYETDADVTIAGGVGVVGVDALTAGQDGNCDAGVALSLESPIAGVNASATVGGAGIVNGSDEEDLEDFRARVIARMQSPPHGGAAADYIAWAREVGGVTRAWCYPLEGGPGTVTVRFVRDDDVSLIPDAGEVAAVQAHIDEVAPVSPRPSRTPSTTRSTSSPTRAPRAPRSRPSSWTSCAASRSRAARFRSRRSRSPSGRPRA
jgi:uncharacterized phage protein gp47/JayE